MIVLLDVNNKCINIYNEDGINKVSFYDIDEIHDYIAPGQKVHYVTNAIETEVANIINLVSNITGKESMTQLNSNVRYLHSTVKGPLNIPDPNARPEEDVTLIRFHDCYDLKILDAALEARIKQYPIILNTIRRGKIEIINEMQKNKILSKRRKAEKNKVKKQKMIDAKLDKVLSSSEMKASDLADNMFGNDDDEDDNKKATILEITDSNINFKTEMDYNHSKMGLK